MRGEKGDRGNRDTDRDIDRLAHPEYRLGPEHEVAQGSAADPGDGRKQRKSDNIHLLARGHQSPGHRKDRNPEQIEHGGQCRSSWQIRCLYWRQATPFAGRNRWYSLPGAPHGYARSRFQTQNRSKSLPLTKHVPMHDVATLGAFVRSACMPPCAPARLSPPTSSFPVGLAYRARPAARHGRERQPSRASRIASARPAIIISQLPGPAYEQFLKSMNSGAIEVPGVTNAKREIMLTEGGAAHLVTGDQEADGMKIRKWLMITRRTVAEQQCRPDLRLRGDGAGPGRSAETSIPTMSFESRSAALRCAARSRGGNSRQDAVHAERARGISRACARSCRAAP